MLIDKPEGLTSHDVVARVRRVLKTRAVGHTGTLDPFATGLLVVLIGRATRLARFVQQQSKLYLATARLGFRTTTDDRTGDRLGPESDAATLAWDAVAGCLLGMTGPQRQTPPAFSAKKVAGERSYRRARKGEAVELAPVEVMVHRIEPLEIALPLVTFRVEVSAGTYIRALARDLGERLGVGGHLDSLRREAVGGIRIDDAVPLDRLDLAALRPVASVLAHLPQIELTDAEANDIRHGRPVRREAAAAEALQLVLNGALVAIGRTDGGLLRPVVVLEGG